MSPVFKSIRFQVQAWHGLILVLVLAGFGFTAYQVAWDNQVRRIDRELEQQLAIVSRPGPPEQLGPRESPGDSPRFRGPPPEEPGMRGPPGEHRRRDHPEAHKAPGFVRGKLQEAIQRAGLADSGQTNSFYYVLWDERGTMLTCTPAAPSDVPLPKRADAAAAASGEELRLPLPAPRSRALMLTITRARGEMREAYRFMPFGDCLLVGRSISPELGGMRRLALWLVAAGGGILVLGLAGGWWVASRAIRPIEEISATALKISGGDLSQRINAADTESELGRLAGVLNSTFARLEAAFAHQARFTSDASHELRTPLSVVLSQTQTALSRERSASEYRESLEVCQRAAQRMRRLTGSLLELARLDAGQERLNHRPFDLAEVARDCVELLLPWARERRTELQSELAPAACAGDPERMAQVVTNLVSNAIQFNRDAGQIRIGTRVEEGFAVLTVSDNGPGIAPEDLPHIFERFYRADKSRSSASGGTGLGLAISKAIVEALSGTLEVSSPPGTGATFIVRLPGAHEQAPPGLVRPQ